MVTQPKLNLRVRQVTPLEAFAAGLRGQLILPSHPDYERARRIWNGLVDKRPALIVRCADTADVASAVKFARRHGLQVAVRGGGHNVAGLVLCDGGMLIDLSRMKGIKVDTLKLTA